MAARNTTFAPFFLSATRWIPHAIFGLAFLLYANTLTHQYALDDAIVLTENEYTTQGLAGIGDILTHDTFTGFFGEEKQLVAGGRYRPLSLVTFALEWQLFGRNPFISHLLNVLLFGLTGVVLYRVLCALFPQDAPWKVWLTAGTAFLFIAHPIHTEAVANIKGRDEILALLASLTALLWTLRYWQTRRLAFVVGSAAIFFLGLLSKENTITFLAVVPVALWLFTDAPFKSVAGLSLPYLLMAGLFLWIRSAVLGAGASIGQEAQELMNNPFLGLNAQERYGTILYSLGKYWQLLVWPHPLTHDYYPRQIPILTFGDVRVIASTAGHLALAGYGAWGLLQARAKATPAWPLQRLLTFSVVYYFATLSIVSNVPFSVGTHLSERFIFMPSVGFALVTMALLWQLFRQRAQVLNALFLGLVVGYALLTVQRNPAWKDNYTLFSTDIRTSTQSAKLNNAMGGITIERAIDPKNAGQKEALLNEAIGYLNTAVELHPQYANAYLLLGNAFYYQANYAKALEYYRFIAQQYDDPNGKNNLLETGKRLAEQQQYQAAIAPLEEAAAYFPNNPEVFGQLGAAYGNLGQHQKAIDNFQRVIALQPSNGRAHLFLGYAYLSLSANAADAAQAASLRATGEGFLQQAYQLDPSLQPQ